MYPSDDELYEADYTTGAVYEASMEPRTSGGYVYGVGAEAVDVYYNVVEGN